MPSLVGIAALGLSLVLVPFMRGVSLRSGKIARPRPDRWNQQPKALFGGVGIFLAWLFGLLASGWWLEGSLATQWQYLWGAGFIFVMGLVDDLVRLTPPTKLIGQIIAATLAISAGVRTDFFTPRLADAELAQLLNILLTYAWLVGITNAINLLDNMDGLAGGIALITGLFLSYSFWSLGNINWLVIALALCGAILGFLIFNFPPASIFMGDSGSQFLGFTLALMAIVRQPQASSVLAVLGVPTLLFVLPILDMLLVTITRILHGLSPVQGGRDHTSHRLIAFGLSERRALLVMYSIAGLMGWAALAIENLDYLLSLVLVPLLVLILAIITTYLGGMQVVSGRAEGSQNRGLARIALELTFKRRIIEVILDFFLITILYYTASLAVFHLGSGEQLLNFFMDTIPYTLAGTYIAFFIFGVYRSVWRYVSLEDVIRFGLAAICAGIFTAGLTYLMLDIQISWLIFLIYIVLLMMGLTGTRSSFKLLDYLSQHQSRRTGEQVLICGAGDEGEIAIRWIQMNPDCAYQPIGFIDLDPYRVGRQIHGVGVLGGPDQINQLIEKHAIAGIILTESFKTEYPEIQKLFVLARSQGCWVRAFRLEFEVIAD